MRKLTLFFVALIFCNASCAWATSQKNLSGRSIRFAYPSSSSLPASTLPASLPASPVPASSLLPAPAPAPAHVSLPQLVREALAVHFNASNFDSLDKLIAATPVCDEYKQPAGLFVTLSSHGKTRACWGSINPTNQDLVRATVFTTEEALSKEYRYPHVRASEWQSLKPQVTIVRALDPIDDISQQNALKYGLLAQYGGRGAVMLPGEVIDARCQLLKCKLKAGIPVDQPCQLYRIRADVLK